MKNHRYLSGTCDFSFRAVFLTIFLKGFDASGRDAPDNRIGSHIFGDDGACRDHGPVTDGDAGTLPGDEVVQLYLRDEYAGMTRPVKELAGFCRVALQPGGKEARQFCRFSKLSGLSRPGHALEN